MRDSVNDGGPAFPTKINSAIDETGGLTIRDWFAGQCIAGLDSGWTPFFDWNDMSDGMYGGSEWHSKARAMRAEYAYAQADAMLEARK